MLKAIPAVLAKLEWMRERRIWPNGLRYLWTDAFGVVLLVSLYRELRDERYLGAAEDLVSEVERVLGRPRGLRIGEEPDRDGQYFHYLAMWMYALERLGAVKAEYHRCAVDLVKAVHPRFVLPGRGVIWKLEEDLSRPYPGSGLGAMDPFHGYVVYRLIDERALASEIEVLATLVAKSYGSLSINQDLGLGMMLCCHTSFRRRIGRSSTASGRSPHSTACGSIRPDTSPDRRDYPRSSSPSPITGSRWDSRQRRPGPRESTA